MSLFNNLLSDIPSTFDDKPKRPLLEHDKDHDYILRIDNTTLERFQTCARSAEFYCVNRRQSRDSAALAFGGAIHEGLAVLYRDGFNQITKAVEVTLAKIKSTWQPEADEWRTPQLACETIIDYAEKYKHDTIKPITYDGELFVERAFSLYLGSIHLDRTLPQTAFELGVTMSEGQDQPLYINKLHILWSGRLDMAVTEGDDNVFVLDHKTTSIMGDQFFADFQLSQQMLGYVWAMRKLLPERNVIGTIVNAIAQRKPTKTGKSLEFKRQTFFQNLWMQEEWERDVMAGIERFVHSLCVGFFPKSPKWCFGKYGKCPYHEVCTLPPDLRMSLLNSGEYVNVTWSPLDK